MWSVTTNSTRQWWELCESVSAKNQFTNVYGLARSLFALCTSITLLFNSQFNLFSAISFSEKQAEPYSGLNLFLIFQYDGLIWAKIIALLILTAVISGYYPRYTGVLHWWVTFSYFNATNVADGGDQVASNVTFFLIFITLMDSRRNHWDKPEKSNPYKNFTASLLYKIIAIQVAALYFHSAVHKLYNVEEWVDGSAIYYWFDNAIFGLNSFTKSIIDPIIDIPVLLFIINWGVILFELVLFCAILSNDRRRKRLFFPAILFHLSIAVLFGLISFFISMSACLLLYLYPTYTPVNLTVWRKTKDNVNREQRAGAQFSEADSFA